MDTSQTSPADSNISQLQSEVASALSSADTNAAQTVQNVQLVQKARLSGLTRAAAAAVTQYGANSPQAQKAQAAVSATTATVARIAVVHQQLSTQAPQVSTTGWALQGRVYNAQSKPVSRYTVFLVNAQMIYQQAYGFAYTDDTGYFLINYSGGQTAAAPQLFIEIANTKAEPVYLSTTAFSPAAGSVSYQNITLPAGEQPLGDPPEEIRKVALPENKS